MTASILMGVIFIARQGMMLAMVGRKVALPISAPDMGWRSMILRIPSRRSSAGALIFRSLSRATRTSGQFVCAAMLRFAVIRITGSFLLMFVTRRIQR